VMVRVTSTNANSNAVVSGIFFGGGGSGGPLPAAAFVKADTTSWGAWKGVYGADGYNVINDSINYPAYVTVTPSGNGNYTWATSTQDPRATQKGTATDRIAACWVGVTSFSLDLTFNDSAMHQIALYFLDWDQYQGGRAQRVDILDTSGRVLDSRNVTSFATGQYLIWNVSGHVVVRVTNTTANSNAVMSGIFFR
jgi:hypothetical protein